MTMQPRNGGALLIVLPCILIIELISAGALALAFVHTADAGLRARQLEVRLARESAVLMAMRSLDSLRIDSLAPGQSITIEPPTIGNIHIRTIAEIRAVGHGIIETVATAYLDGRPAGSSAAIVHALHAHTIWKGFTAALRTHGDVVVDDAASITAATTSASSGTAAQTCPAEATRAADRAGARIVAGLAAPATRSVHVAPLATVLGSPPVQLDVGDTTQAHALRSMVHALTTLADHRMPGSTITPRPTTVAGHCVTLDPANWGDPSGLTTCNSHRPLIAVDGDLHISGGSAQAFLVVNGNLHIDDKARFDGAILVTGNVDVGNASITGAVHSLGTGVSRVAGSIRHDICPLWRSFTAPAPRRAWRTGTRAWLPMD